MLEAVQPVAQALLTAPKATKLDKAVPQASNIPVTTPQAASKVALLPGLLNNIVIPVQLLCPMCCVSG